MSDTPLTDAASRIIGPIAGSGVEVVEIEISRQFERDRAELIEALRWLHYDTCLLLQSKPVRNMDETLSNATRLLERMK